jgi:hypothetical protein
MIVLAAGGKGERVWERQQEDAAVHLQGARNVPPPTFFIWDRGQRHEAIEQAPTNISGLVKDGVQALRAGMAVWIDQLRPNTLAGSFVGFPQRFTELHRPLAAGLHLKLREHEIACTRKHGVWQIPEKNWHGSLLSRCVGPPVARPPR